MTDDIVHEATYPYPPSAVWRAIATREAMSAWLMETDFAEPRVGHRFQFRDKPKKVVGWNGITDCEVLEVVPERRLVFSFSSATDTPTRVIWELEPVHGGTRVRFRHTGFTGLKGWLMRAGMNQGWGGMVRHGIPYVLARFAVGEVPTRAETTAARKAGTRREGAVAKAKV